MAEVISYDSGDYYHNDKACSRLSPGFNALFKVFEWWKAFWLLKKVGLRTGYVLDVGAGDGKFLNLLKKRGFKCLGTTLSRKTALAARENFGLEVQYRCDLPHSEVGYDLITYWHVYEHLENSQEHEKRWAGLMVDGGTLVIEVPNPCSVGAKLCYRSWLGSDEKHHVNHRSPGELQRILEKQGLEVFRFEQFSLKFSYVYLWSALLGCLAERAYDFENILGTLRSPLVVFRKRPFWSLNLFLSLAYLAPLIVFLILYGLLTGQGEVARFFARKSQQ